MTEENSGRLRDGQPRSTVLLTHLLQYGVALLLVALALGANLLFYSYLEPTPTPLFFAAVMVSAWYGGLGPGLLATLLSTLAINYFYIEPTHSFDVSNLAYVVRSGVFVMAATLINSLNQAQRSARRRAEANLQALRESEARFSCLAESGIIGTIVADLNGAVIDANPAFLQMVGYTSEDLRAGRIRWQEMTPPEYFEVSQRSQEELRERGVCTPFEKEYIRKDGSRIPILLGSAMLRENTIIGFVLNIAKRKQAEEILRASEERFQLITQASNDVIWDCNLLTHETWWSDRVQIVFGYPPEAMGADRISWAERVHPDDLERIEASYQACLAGSATVWTDEYRFCRANGSYADILDRAFILRDAAGDPLRVVGAMSDITDRKQVQQELQHTLQTLQTLVAASPLPIIVIEPDDMTVKLWNAAAEQLFGWSEAEILGKPIPIVPEEKQEECRQLREAITRGEVFFGTETYRCKRNGSAVVLNISAAPLYNDLGSVDAILLILQDITERQRAEASLRDSEERLRLALIAANQGLYDLNVQTGDAIVSAAYAEMLGYAPTEFQETNAKWRERLHPDDVATVYQAYEDYISGKLDTYRVEFRQRTQSGDWKWILSIGKIVA